MIHMPVNFKKPRILIVDDDTTIRNLLKMFYACYDFELFEAANGQQAIAMATTCKPDLILLDIQMPECNGYTTVAILRNDAATKNVPILLITGQAFEEVKAKASGMYDEYLSKPFRKDDVIKATLRYLPEAVKRPKDAKKEKVYSDSHN
ncbi:MAG: response regulator [Deltaproteobacteria bacterium]|nr:response regulator [Deltaproteobacteria bacterium]